MLTRILRFMGLALKRHFGWVIPTMAWPMASVVRPCMVWLCLFPFRTVKLLIFSCWSSPIIIGFKTEEMHGGITRIIGLTENEDALVTVRLWFGVVFYIAGMIGDAVGLELGGRKICVLLGCIFLMPWLVSLALSIARSVYRLSAKIFTTEKEKLAKDWEESKSPKVADADSLGRSSEDTANLPHLPVGGPIDSDSLPRIYSADENNDNLHCGLTNS